MMAHAFQEVHRTLKAAGELVIVYAHKTTLGWATLVDALRRAGFVVTEAWPLDTEMGARLRAMDSAALASSIFLAARKREGSTVGSCEGQVKPELEEIVRERLDTLWPVGISGADLVIACVGAGLRAFTRFSRVEYANGEEVPAERFLTEVETVVLEQILERLAKEAEKKAKEDAQRRGQELLKAPAISLAHLDAPTRFYVLWRYTYGAGDLDAGEAIVFANGTHVELDGPHGLSTGANAILEKKKSSYRLRDFTERGEDADLGLADKDGNPPPTIDVLHRLLWLLEHRPPLTPEFLAGCGAGAEQLRLVAQALAGPALKGGELADVSPSAEQATLGRLLANWNAVVQGKAVVQDRQKGQGRFL
jgi:putative DNA methylase